MFIRILAIRKCLLTIVFRRRTKIAVVLSHRIVLERLIDSVSPHKHTRVGLVHRFLSLTLCQADGRGAEDQAKENHSLFAHMYSWSETRSQIGFYSNRRSAKTYTRNSVV